MSLHVYLVTENRNKYPLIAALGPDVNKRNALFLLFYRKPENGNQPAPTWTNCME